MKKDIQVSEIFTSSKTTKTLSVQIFLQKMNELKPKKKKFLSKVSLEPKPLGGPNL